MINIPKGTKDVLPTQSFKWNLVDDAVAKMRHKYNLKEIKTPVFEHTELFVRGVGDATDIVNKEMYTFLDKGGRSITLKPEGTAGVARSFIENGLFNEALPLKLYYLTNCFRYERPQAGRLRQHTQFGCECFGADTAVSDAEVIMLATDFYKEFGINPTAKINNLGCPECRKKYIDLLKQYFAPKIQSMCEDCKKRYDINPLRLLDCKVDVCKQQGVEAPKIIDVLCQDCNQRFNELTSILDANEVNYKVDTMLVRGLDYYTNLVFEFTDEDKVLGQNALGGGGRYNNMIEQLGGKATPVVGFGIGIERLLLYVENKGIELKNNQNPKVFVANATENIIAIMDLVKQLRDNNVSTEMNIAGKSLKAQFKYADKLSAEYVVTVGDDELVTNKYKVKSLKDGNQVELDKNELIKFFVG